MSYIDDEELKIGAVEEEGADLDIDHSLDLSDPTEDDPLPNDEEVLSEGFAGLDGAEY